MEHHINPDDQPIHYVIIDGHTKKQVAGPIKSHAGATRLRDSMDNQYGACRYITKPIYKDTAK